MSYSHWPKKSYFETTCIYIIVLESLLSYWGRNKMADILQTAFSNDFSSKKLSLFFIQISKIFINEVLIDKKESADSGNGFTPNEQQAIALNQWWPRLLTRILVKTATLQNGHTQNGHNTVGYQNGHNRNGHTLVGQNGHRGRVSTETAIIYLVKTATGGSLPKWPHFICSKRPQKGDYWKDCRIILSQFILNRYPKLSAGIYKQHNHSKIL